MDNQISKDNKVNDPVAPPSMPVPDQPTEPSDSPAEGAQVPEEIATRENTGDGSPVAPAQPITPQTPQNMEKVGEHILTNGEIALFGEMYASFDRLRQLVAIYLCDKHGYPEKEPVAFEFNWPNRTVTAFRPTGTPASSIEVTSDAPSAPAPNKIT